MHPGIQALDLSRLCGLIPAPNTNGGFLKGVPNIAVRYNEYLKPISFSSFVMYLLFKYWMK